MNDRDVRIVLPGKINTVSLNGNRKNVFDAKGGDQMKLVHFFKDSYHCPDKDLRITI